MPSTNGRHPKRAILYARVSTEEQARSGYSLAQQMETLRGYATREGYEIVEEVGDPGQSGASLERPGMDRVRDLVAAGGVSFVLAQDRDRFAREPAYVYLLREECAEQGTKLQALNDRGDDSPEGELANGIFDQFAKYERMKMAERSRRGKMRKARQGEVVASIRPSYGYQFTEDRKGYEVDPQKMSVVKRIFEMVAAGSSFHSVKKVLESEGVPTPTGGWCWRHSTLQRIIDNEVYRTRDLDELRGLLAPEMVNRLGPNVRYGICWYGKKRHIQTQRTGVGPNGKRRYSKGKRTEDVPKEQWIGIPVPDSGIPPEVVDVARKRRGTYRKAATGSDRYWDLSGGVLRCGGCVMSGVPTGKRRGRRRYYYRCPNRARNGLRACSMNKNFRAERLEAEVWEEVSSLLKEPERLRAGIEHMIEEERTSLHKDPTQEIERWRAEIEKIEQMRGGYLDQQAEGIITIGELKSKIAGLQERREIAEQELEKLTHHQERVAKLECEAGALVEHFRFQAREGLDLFTPEDRRDAYKALGLKVIAHADGVAELTGSAIVESSGSDSDTRQASAGLRRRLSGASGPWSRGRTPPSPPSRRAGTGSPTRTGSRRP
jgi:site-specific DNA recombinase